MHIKDVKLYTTDLAAQAAFYIDKLGLAPVHRAADQFTVTVGRSTLTLMAAETAQIHHLAFDIPEHQFEAALTWADERLTLMPYEGEKFIDFSQTNWQAHSLYFEDAAGNVLEFIGRHRLPMPEAPTPFGIQNLQNISEVGLATDDLPGLVAQLQAKLDLPIFSGGPTGAFCALGDDHGLLICVKTGRPWLPTDNRLSAVHPVQMTIRGDAPATYSLEGHPYQITVS